MADALRYIDPATGTVQVDPSVKTPSLTHEYSGSRLGTAKVMEVTLSISGSSPYSYAIDGLHENLMDGGPYVPHGALHGKETILEADASASATALVVEQHLTPDDRPILEAGVPYLVMHRRPKQGESIWGNTGLAPEIITIDSGYDYTGSTGTNDGVNPTISALTTARKKGAVLQKVVGYPASYDMERGTFGQRYRLEQPASVAITATADGGTQTVNVSFNKATQKAVSAYMIQILKKGDALSPYGAPVSIPEDVLESQYDDTGQQDAIFALDSTRLVESEGVITVSSLNRYYNPETRTVTAITAGVYYVAVRALTQTTKDANLRMSDASVMAVTVA